jgi:Fe2+ or Zn2+ uptake regulation protein
MWMNKASEPVLELLADSKLALSPSVIVLNLKRELDDAPSRSTVYRAFDGLLKHKLIQEVDTEGTYYEITSRGERYLTGTLSEEELEELRD